MSEVLIIGAGVIGLSIAYRAAQAGLTVQVVDPDPGSGASWTAAGMLAPVTELHFGEAPLLQLNLESLRRYPAFVAELVDLTALEIRYRRCGTVVAAWDAADLAGLRDLAAFARTLGQQPQLLTGSELRRLLPQAAGGLPGGLFAPDDDQIDNRDLHRALQAATLQLRVPTERAQVQTVTETAGRVDGVQLTDGRRLSAEQVVLAAGAWSSSIGGLESSGLPAVRPVKGQTLRLRIDPADPLPHTVRGSVKGSPVYVVGRDGGEVVVGASTEEVGFDLRPRAGAVYELLRDAQSLLPMLAEAEVVELCTSVRPGSPDNAPLIGPTAQPGLIAATGHYRNGILLAPVTADAVAQYLTSATMPAAVGPFGVDRFARVGGLR